MRKFRLIRLIQYRLGLVDTAAAIFGDAKAFSELIEVVHASGCRFTDLLVGYRFTDADVHKFNNLAHFQ